MTFSLKLAWPRYLACARALLAGAGLIAFYRYVPAAPPALLGGLGVFLAYALFLAIRGSGQSGMLGLLALFVDAVYFLVLASFGVFPEISLIS